MHAELGRRREPTPRRTDVAAYALRVHLAARDALRDALTATRRATRTRVLCHLSLRIGADVHAYAVRGRGALHPLVERLAPGGFIFEYL